MVNNYRRSCFFTTAPKLPRLDYTAGFGTVARRPSASRPDPARSERCGPAGW